MSTPIASNMGTRGDGSTFRTDRDTSDARWANFMGRNTPKGAGGGFSNRQLGAFISQERARAARR